MKLNSLFLAMGLAGMTGLAQAGTVEQAHHTHWSYAGHEGPEHWGELSEEYKLCSTGQTQSPVDIEGTADKDLAALVPNYNVAGSSILDNGHTVQVNFAQGDKLTVGDHIYALKQFHFHTPSENHISGKAFPMEVHLVHADEQGHLAVIGVMFTEGKANPTLTAMLAEMPQGKNHEEALKEGLSAKGLLPADLDYYTFNGSLTTPPCTEGVTWLSLAHPIEASKEQINEMHVRLGNNNRPVQELHARVIQK